MTKFSFSGFLLCIFFFSSIAKGQSVTYTAKKHKGKWALIGDNNTPVTEYAYDSITSRVYTFSTLDRTSTPLKVIQPEKTIYFLWQNGRFDVFYKMIVVSGVSAFEPCSRLTDDLLKYSFRTGNSWGWGINRGNPSKPSENYNSPASYDSVRFLITQQFLTDPEALAKNDNQMDLTGYTYYALYLSTDIQAYKDGCLLVISSYSYSEKKFCDVLYFVSIPEVFMVKKKAAGNIKFVRADERFSQFEYDSVASIYGLWMGFNKGQATADIFTDTSRSTVPYTAVTNWIAVRDQFKKDNIKNDLAIKEKETVKRQQEEAANIKKREQQLQDELVKKKAGARERLKQIKEMNMMVYTWKNNDSLLGLRIRGRELIYPSAKKVDLNGHSDFIPVVFTPGGNENITMSPAYKLKYSAKDSLELLPEELYVKILHTIDI